MNGRNEYKDLTGFKPTGKARYRILVPVDTYGIVWSEYKGAQTYDKAKLEAGKIRHGQTKIIDLEEV